MLGQALARREAVNVTFAAGPPKSAAADWADEWVKLVGPEIFRKSFRGAVSADEALVWARDWANPSRSSPLGIRICLGWFDGGKS